MPLGILYIMNVEKYFLKCVKIWKLNPVKILALTTIKVMFMYVPAKTFEQAVIIN